MAGKRSIKAAPWAAAEELMKEFSLIAEAFDGFADARGELIVVMFERNGDRYIRLGEIAKYNCGD